MNIVIEIKKEIIKRSNEFERKTKGTKDEYNIYKDHIQYVYKYVCILGKNKKVDLEVLKISALLHDVSMTDSNLDRSKHNEYSSIIAEQLLKEKKYPIDKIEKVKKCILNHSSKRKDYRTSLEEQILVDADNLSHFEAIKSLYSLAHNVMDLNDEDSLQFIKDKLTKDYKEISSELKPLIQEKYNIVINSKDINEIINL